ncbi:MAG: hydroxymethylglutaryl-CoA lyase [Bacteroidia bacterium]
MTYQWVECPRDAWQGQSFIPTEKKISYLRLLRQVGFHTIDAGSFVSPKAVPQMADTQEVFDALAPEKGSPLLAIVANLRGASEAAQHPAVRFIGYPFSLSERFQQENTRRTLAQSWDLLDQILNLTRQAHKTLVIYLSMGFGNPYGEPWSPQLLVDFAARMVEKGISIVSLADTVGVARAEDIYAAFSHLTRAYPDVTWGVHLHTHPKNQLEKVRAAWDGGCRRFDTALLGLGGCPFASDNLIGNLPAETFLAFLRQEGLPIYINEDLFAQAQQMAKAIFATS